MPLPPSNHRTELHQRTLEMRGYRRDDGRYEIEGHLVDTKGQPLTIDGRDIVPGQPVHDMWVRLVVDENLVVHDIIAVTDVAPYPACREATDAMRLVIGERIAHGWTNMVKSRLGGIVGCTHLMEMLMPLGTVAYQTLTHARVAQPDRRDHRGKPVKIDTCYAYASQRDIVKRRWPEFYTGDRRTS